MKTASLMHRTVGCGEVQESHARGAERVVLTGWVHRRRDLGNLIFIELRDRSGRVQVVFDPTEDAAAHRAAEGLRSESVVGISGVVAMREAPNPDHPTGHVEVRGREVAIHSLAEKVPIPVDSEQTANEEARLRYRYVELRGAELQERLRLRHRLSRAARDVLDRNGFTEVETPILTRSTPEGARDYLVPSRVHPGSFYALPQSPQLFKQLLMVAGFERYYQFARCFRDEDLRADRQPEFTQVDIEMSFVTPEDVYGLVEEIVAAMFREIGVDIERPLRRMPFAEAMSRYGTDRPDTRFGMELVELTDRCRDTGFRVFDDVLARGGRIRGIPVPGAADASRKVLDGWTARAKKHGAGGLIWIKLSEGDGSVQSSALKVLGEEKCRDLAESCGAGPGDAALLVADRGVVCDAALGSLRVELARERGIVPEDRQDLLWVEDFPLVFRDEEADRWASYHHPFTAPAWEELAGLDAAPGDVRSQAYDLVLNGTEIGGGSIRIHRRDVQEKVFAALAISPEEAREKFGFLLEALDAGAPPHGGIALGFDRIAAMLSRSESIRDVIAFPKTTSASDLMTASPAPVEPEQLAELGIACATKDVKS